MADPVGANVFLTDNFKKNITKKINKYSLIEQSVPSAYQNIKYSNITVNLFVVPHQTYQSRYTTASN